MFPPQSVFNVKDVLLLEAPISFARFLWMHKMPRRGYGDDYYSDLGHSHASEPSAT